MSDERRFTVVAVLISGLSNEPEYPMRLHRFFREAYMDSDDVEEGDFSSPDGSVEEKSMHIWKGIYMHTSPADLISDLNEYVNHYEIDPDKILVILGEPERIGTIKDAISFSAVLEKYVKAGVNLLAITEVDWYAQLDYEHENAHVFPLKPETILPAMIGGGENRASLGKTFRSFVENNF